MKTKEEILEFLEIEELDSLESVVIEHSDWDSIVALDLANYCEKQGVRESNFDYVEWFTNLTWKELFKELNVQ